MTEQQQQQLSQVLQEGYSISSSQCMQEGLRLYLSQFRLFAIYSLITVGVGLVFSLVWPGFYQLIAFTVLISPLLNAGYFLAADQLVMHNKLALADFFGGLSRPLPLIGSSVIYWAILVLLLTPTYFALQDAGVIDWYFANIGQTEPLADPPEVSGQGPTIIFLNLLPVAYLTVAYAWAYPLILFFHTSAWSALEWSRRLVTKQWGRVCLIFFSFTGLILTVSLIFNVLATALPAAALFLQIAIALLMPWLYCTLYAAFARASFAARLPPQEQ